MNTQAFSCLRGRAARYAATVLGAVVLALGAFAPVVAQAAAPAAAVTTSIALKPSSGPPTSTVTVTGTGFGASETVAVDFSGTQVATAATSPTGTFSATFKVPASAPPGKDPVIATGQASGRSATRDFLVQTNWAQFHFSPANSGFNPYENVISPASVPGLKLAWTNNSAGSIGSAPAVANGVLYVGTQFNGLQAFSAAGTGCSGSPVTCNPLWTGTAVYGVTGGSDPAVSGKVVYVSAYKGIAAFSAAGCGSATCNPLWTGPNIGGTTSSPAVAGGKVYVGAALGLAAFSAAGCGAATCNPLWTFSTGAEIVASPAVANGVVYVPDTSHSTLYALSTAGTLLWTAASVYGFDSPAVANGVVYAAASGGALYAFSAAGTTGCSGSPRVCAPLWTSPAGTSISYSSPAVANGMVYVGQWTVFSQYLLAFK